MTVDFSEARRSLRMARWARYPANNVPSYCGGRWSRAFWEVSELEMDAHLSVIVLSGRKTTLVPAAMVYGPTTNISFEAGAGYG